MPWRPLHDPDNPENAAAASPSDLLKHTVYLSLLDLLLTRDGAAIRVRECHAGRGLYRLPEGDPRRELVARLLATDTPLAQAQREILAALDAPGCYAGSALLVARRLGSGDRYEGYEWDPATRRILAHVLRELAPSLEVRIPHAFEDVRFDGESHVADALPTWGRRDVVLLDPFGLWRHPKHAFRRARYRRIAEGFAARGEEAPVLSLFFTWGRGAEADCAELAALGAPRVVVRWRWELSAAMWLVVPAGLCDVLASTIEARGRRLLCALAPADAALSVELVR